MAEAPQGESPNFKLVGAANFKRHNPLSDRFESLGWDHLEWWCTDATATARRFSEALGMQLVARSDLVTGNELYSSYVMNTNNILFTFTAPMGTHGKTQPRDSVTFHTFDTDKCFNWIRKHGLGVRAIGIQVKDAKDAYEKCVALGAKGELEPTLLSDRDEGKVIISEIILYDDTVLRFVQREGFKGRFLPGFVDEPVRPPINYGIVRMDHVVSNVPKLADIIPNVMKWTGFHEFAEFVSDDVGTSESGLNSIVLANNEEMILLPFNEPTFGTKRKSQIQTYLEYFEGSGVQHIALKTDDIFKTVETMKGAGAFSGFEFVPKPSKAYYENLPNRLGKKLTEEQYKECERLGILADIDPEGELLQIFTRPVGDRPTVFFEIIQRLGCANNPQKIQKPGCGGFGKGNFGELFKSIEDFEKEVEKVKESVKERAALTITKA